MCDAYLAATVRGHDDVSNTLDDHETFHVGWAMPVPPNGEFAAAGLQQNPSKPLCFAFSFVHGVVTEVQPKVNPPPIRKHLNLNFNLIPHHPV
ncbi:hypothetical protein CMEL01_13363 [Colletotrichum melonis]|uniref:Uncharacterized protein n=1 Tax=Colletotrichum melonis TaxID=1209925 RepID=A0AAI9UUF9_9PEZI|nr:hypothetical protein CMEL01_13363 [Colletotrichum melonis]